MDIHREVPANKYNTNKHVSLHFLDEVSGTSDRQPFGLTEDLNREVLHLNKINGKDMNIWGILRISLFLLFFLSH